MGVPKNLGVGVPLSTTIPEEWAQVMFRVVPLQGTATKPVQDSRTFSNQEKKFDFQYNKKKKQKSS